MWELGAWVARAGGHPAAHALARLRSRRPPRARPLTPSAPPIPRRYVPLALVQLGLLEAGGLPTAACAGLALAFGAARTMHAAAMSGEANFKWRVRGTMGTGMVLMIQSALLVAVAAGVVGGGGA